MTFKPMLASEADLTKVQFPMAASPKLDGIRCSIVKGQALSRTLKAIPNRHITELLSKPEYTGLDGELIVGVPHAKDVYRTTVSGVMSRDGEPDFTFRVFDMFDVPSGWSGRFQEVEAQFSKHTHILPVEHTIVHSLDELTEYESRTVALGYEGVMLRKLNGHYKLGRSTTREGLLLKVKQFQDSEAEILDVVEEMHNGNEATTDNLGRTKRSSHKENKVGKARMGALKVRDVHTGVEFELGTGFNDADKQQFWLNDRRGQLVKYKFFPVGVKDKPRHPVYLGLRDRIDL